MVKNMGAKVNEYIDTECYKLFMSLFKELLESNRSANDTAVGDEVLRNQGAIKQLKALINMQVIRPSKYGTQDGGFSINI